MTLIFQRDWVNCWVKCLMFWISECLLLVLFNLFVHPVHFLWRQPSSETPTHVLRSLAFLTHSLLGGFCREVHSLTDMFRTRGEQQLMCKGVTFQLYHLCHSREGRDSRGQALRPESSNSKVLLGECPWEVPGDNPCRLLGASCEGPWTLGWGDWSWRLWRATGAHSRQITIFLYRLHLISHNRTLLRKARFGLFFP